MYPDTNVFQYQNDAVIISQKVVMQCDAYIAYCLSPSIFFLDVALSIIV